LARELATENRLAKPKKAIFHVTDFPRIFCVQRFRGVRWQLKPSVPSSPRALHPTTVADTDPSENKVIQYAKKTIISG